MFTAEAVLRQYKKLSLNCNLTESDVYCGSGIETNTPLRMKFVYIVNPMFTAEAVLRPNFLQSLFNLFTK